MNDLSLFIQLVNAPFNQMRSAAYSPKCACVRLRERKRRLPIAGETKYFLVFSSSTLNHRRFEWTVVLFFDVVVDFYRTHL